MYRGHISPSPPPPHNSELISVNSMECRYYSCFDWSTRSAERGVENMICEPAPNACWLIAVNTALLQYSTMVLLLEPAPGTVKSPIGYATPFYPIWNPKTICAFVPISFVHYIYIYIHVNTYQVRFIGQCLYLLYTSIARCWCQCTALKGWVPLIPPSIPNKTKQASRWYMLLFQHPVCGHTYISSCFLYLLLYLYIYIYVLLLSQKTTQKT